MRARAIVCKFFSSYNQKMRKGEFFKLAKIRIKIQVYEVRKKWKTNVWNLELGQKILKLFFQKTRACARGGENFTNKGCANGSSLSK